VSQVQFQFLFVAEGDPQIFPALIDTEAVLNSFEEIDNSSTTLLKAAWMTFESRFECAGKIFIFYLSLSTLETSIIQLVKRGQIEGYFGIMPEKLICLGVILLLSPDRQLKWMMRR